MKGHADKSSTTSTSTVSQVAQPFVARKGTGSFFAPARGPVAPGPQTKMTVNAPGDKFEQEADKTADTVMRMPALATPAKEERLQRQVDERVQKKEEDKLQRAGADGAPIVSPDVQSGICDQMSRGQSLGGDARLNMEPRFGADFSGVRIHTDAQSAALSSQLGARAFTLQNHIFFARDEYQPGISGGQQLLAHELTHTIQQGAARTTEGPAGIQRAPAKGAAPVATSSEVVNLASGTFSPSQKVHDEIEAQAGKGLAVRVVVKGLTDEGQVRIRVDGSKNYSSAGKGSMPLLNPWTQQLGGMHVNFIVTHNEIKNGYASLKPGGGDINDWLQAVQKTSSLLGGLGLKVGHLPTVVNKFDGKLTLGVSNLKVEIGGYVDALLNLSLENTNKPKIDATADVNVKGIAQGQLKLDNLQDKLAGEISLAVNLTAFSGAAKVKYNADGTVDIGGKAAYNANKLSGEIQFVATDVETAIAFAKDAIKAAGGKDKVQDAQPPAPVPAPKAGKKQRGLAATGQLAFNLTTWFAGTVNVVADAKGDITVIGKIAPPGEIVLFKQRDWDKELVKFEAKAYYGIPVVGNLNLFANISLHALASLGPAKIYQIEILGTYSTDPEIQKSIQISGSFNISAYAGLRLRAEGGAGIEIVEHDLKFGVGLNADVGVKAYADARPTIGYRDPGEFYVSGTLEMVAQPMLGLGGDFFIELETPWWSPLSDDKWVWPLFSKEWPLTDPIGLKAVVKEYVLGSGKVPEIELKAPEFDPSKFMTNMVDRTLPDKSGGKGAGQGTFKDDGSVPPPVVPPKKPEPKKADAKPGKKGAPPKAGKSGSPDAKAAKDQASTKILQAAAKDLKALQGKGPYSRAALDDQLKPIKQKTSGISFDVQAKGDKWLVTPKAGSSRGKALEIKAQIEKGQEKDKPDDRTPEQKQADLQKGVNEAKALLADERTSVIEVRKKLPAIKSKYKMTALDVVQDEKSGGKEKDHIHGVINPTLDSESVDKVSDDDLEILKAYTGTHLFAEPEIQGQNLAGPGGGGTLIAAGIKKGTLYELKPRGRRDPFTTISLYSFDSAKANVSSYGNKRNDYGFNNALIPAATESAVLDMGLDPAIAATAPAKRTLAWHTKNGRYTCVRTGKTGLAYAQVSLGHQGGTGASDYWNNQGHRQTKSQNQAWNNAISTYWGPEDNAASKESGPASALYRIPAKFFGSNTMWL